VQEAFEWALGAMGVPVVVSVCQWRDHTDGHVFINWVHWNDEPDVYDLFPDALIRVVSFRPGSRTVPTEGDVACWMRWQEQGSPPDDWLLADGTRFRSVRDVVRALLDRAPMSEEQTILGEWWEPSARRAARREEIRRDWAETKARTAARERGVDDRRDAAPQVTRG
jgi:hypothetical protein